MLKQAYNSELFREKGHQLVDVIADYLQVIQQPDTRAKVLDWSSPEEQLAYWRQQFHTSNKVDFIALAQKITERSIHLHHPNYMGHQVVPPAPDAALMGFLTGVLNNSTAIYEMGSVGVALERIICEELCQQLQYPQQAGGFLTSGGTLANLTAMLTARKIKAPSNVWANGHQQQLGVMVSAEAHYCIDRALRIMGLGSKGSIKIPVNEQYAMQVELLEQYYKEAEEAGIKVIAVVGNACSTSTGSYDNLQLIADFCAKYNLWFHVDGAHGAPAALTTKYKHLVASMERADSIVIDGHKMMMLPSLATFLLYKNAMHASATFSQEAQYLWEKAYEDEWYNIAKQTFECTKHTAIMKFYVLLKQYGWSLFAEYVEKMYDLGAVFGMLINKHPRFELATVPQTNIVCFRYLPEAKHQYTLAEINELNRRIRQQVLHNGRFFVVQTSLNDRLYLRLSIMSPATTEQHLEKLIDYVVITAQKIILNTTTMNQ